MPARAALPWTLTVSLLVGFPALNFIYWPEVLQSGALPVYGDSVGIPMFGSILLALVVSPFAVGITWLCCRRYNPRTRLLAYRVDRPYRSAIVTAIFGLGAAILFFGALVDAARAMPWYEYLWPAYTMAIVAWLLTLRASLIEQRTVEEADAEGQLSN
jgi:hypothetical protein